MEQPNLKYIKSLSNGDVSFEEKIILVLKKEFPIEVDTFLKNFKEKNYIEATDNIHKLKHKISLLGLEKDFELASKFELQLKNEEENLYQEFVKILNKISLYLDKF